jgi:SAM-dependent methyltransferase
MTDDAMLHPEQVRADYNQTLRDIQGEYIQYRWLGSAPQRRHYAQTRRSLQWAAGAGVSGRLLEVGCGPAVWTPLFLPTATEATLLDISDEMLDGARRALQKHSNVSFVRADFTSATLEPQSCDTAVSIRAFEYLPDKSAALERFAAAIRPGGRFILVTKNAGWRDHQRAQSGARVGAGAEVPRHIRLQAGVVSWHDLAVMAQAAGFREVSIHPVVLGSYLGVGPSRPALSLFDLIQRLSYRGPMRPILDPWTESVMLLARR